MIGRATTPCAEALAAIHAEAFETPWPAPAFAELLDQPGVLLEVEPTAFILIRVVADEAEILTLAVRPSSRRTGLGARLTKAAAERALSAGAQRLFLEVAEDNIAARALYDRMGFEAAGRRPRYYARADGPPADALLLVLNLVGPLPRG
jgi:ribosomal-protein-alanine N-acetyltransferase